MPILASPVVAERKTSGSGTAQFTDLAPGSYYVELGRRTGCADWYPSKFTNNRSYFKGLDRTAERWKSFSTLGALPGNQRSGFEYLARTAQPEPRDLRRAGQASAWLRRLDVSHALQGARLRRDQDRQHLRSEQPQQRQPAIDQGRDRPWPRQPGQGAHQPGDDGDAVVVGRHAGPAQRPDRRRRASSTSPVWRPAATRSRSTPTRGAVSAATSPAASSSPSAPDVCTPRATSSSTDRAGFTSGTSLVA